MLFVAFEDVRKEIPTSTKKYAAIIRIIIVVLSPLLINLFQKDKNTERVKKND